MGMQGANLKTTPAETEELPAIVSEPSFNYASVIGMLQYLWNILDWIFHLQ
jgi:hypothetical protein